ncbi:MAG TPA: NB-ARC domain-containing protein [Cyanobacteria bacterium UBA8803]|nr:NB-ARC domain-containing protein [Cyanobacteria bacterium UBA9273]HBL58543.1 NB-ARC domain-containing protein [Cyanobacteria bacterium UBA8803]
MNLQKSRRKRGVILTPQGWEKFQRARTEAEDCDNDGIRYTLEALSFRIGLDSDTLCKVCDRQVGVDKNTLHRCFAAFSLFLEPRDYYRPELPSERVAELGAGRVKVRRDWDEAPDCGVFYGRTEELAQLESWILEERSRLVALVGMGGMGKTCLSVKLAEQIQDRFEFVIWRSLHHAYPVKELLAGLLKFLANDTEVNLPETVDGRISQLIQYLREHRCLLVFDNMETILQGCDRATDLCHCMGYYGEGYEGYGELLKRLGETPHQSCLVLTSREKPKEIALLEGAILPVRSLPVKGLPAAAAQKILTANGCFWESLNDCNQIVDFYGGNPLALKIISRTIQTLFDGNLSEFLQQKPGVFGHIRYLLDRHFERLSDPEKEIINWLSSNHQPASFSQLREQISPQMSPTNLLEALESLTERCLIDKATPKFIDKGSTLFYLQPVVREYAISSSLSR